MKHVLFIFLSLFLLNGLFAEQSASSQTIDSQKEKLAIYKKTAEMHRDNNNYAKAIEAYLKSIKIYKKMAQQEPKNNAWNIALLQSYNNLSVMYEKSGNKEKTIESRKNAVKVAEKMDKHNTDNPVVDLTPYEHSEMAMMGAIIKAFQETMQQGSEQAGKKILEDKKHQSTDQNIQEQLKRLKQHESFTKFDSDHNVWLWHRQLAKEYKRLARMYKSRYREADYANKAIHLYKKSRNTHHFLVKKISDPDLRNDFIHSHCLLGDMYRLVGKNDEAFHVYQTALTMMRKLQKDFPDKDFISDTMEFGYGGLNGEHSIHFAEIYRKLDIVRKINDKGDTKTVFK